MFLEAEKIMWPAVFHRKQDRRAATFESQPL